MNSTSFFPGFHNLLFGRPPISQREAFERQRAKLGASSIEALQGIFSGRLPMDLLCKPDYGTKIRERIFSPAILFWAFLSQVLSPGSACREAVSKVQAFFKLADQSPPAGETGAYCQARSRVPLKHLEKVHRHVRDGVEASAPRELLWKGRMARVVDGTAVSMPDTPENQKAYPQPSGQKPGCGFPVMRLVALFSLTTGTLLEVVRGTLHQAETLLLKQLWQCLAAGKILLGDRGFCSFGNIASLLVKKVDVLFRNHQRRPSDFRVGKRLGKNDHLIVWRKPRCPKGVSKEDYATWPESLILREIKVVICVPGMRTRTLILITSLLDADLYSLAEISDLYLRRWKVELFFDDIKTSMGMDILRCKTPTMIHKELTMHLIAYNLIRSLMLDVASIKHVALGQVSFKGTADRVRQWSWPIAMAPTRKKRKELIDSLLDSIAGDLVPDRPHRKEPRVKKRRPKSYQLMTQPRSIMVEVPHRSHCQRKIPNGLNQVPFLPDPFFLFAPFSFSLFQVSWESRCHPGRRPAIF